MGTHHTELIAVRTGEELGVERLGRYLRKALPDMFTDDVEILQFAAGHSNLTYLIRSGQSELVLRRAPLGPVAAKAHDMGREFQVLCAVHPVFALAPKPILFCEDVDVIGAPFQIMERRRGIVVDREWPDVYDCTPELVRKVSLSQIETLAKLHAIDYETTQLGQWVHPQGYLERQVHGWITRYERAKTDEISAADEVKQKLSSHIPVSLAPTIVHNDLKLNNMLLSPDNPGEVVAVVDWEMATVGDPLTDLATTLSYWAQPGDSDAMLHFSGGLEHLPGAATRADMIETYAKLTGRDVRNMRYYQMFATFKVAVICQQIYYRWQRGQTKDERFAELGDVARGLIESAVDLG